MSATDDILPALLASLNAMLPNVEKTKSLLLEILMGSCESSRLSAVQTVVEMMRSGYIKVDEGSEILCHNAADPHPAVANCVQSFFVPCTLIHPLSVYVNDLCKKTDFAEKGTTLVYPLLAHLASSIKPNTAGDIFRTTSISSVKKLF